MENSEQNRQLTSWKEIAQYLGRDIRTCWRWEKQYGLPVHRVDSESPKSRVYAFKDELDEWLRRTKHSRTIGQKNSVHRPSWKYILFIGIPALAAVGVILLLILPKISGPTEPADFRIKGTALVILNEQGKELWRYETGLENLSDENHYRRSFQFRQAKDSIGGHQLPNLILKDINSDGKIEVLFSTQTKDEMGEGELICFNNRGDELWRFKAGREMKFGSMVYSDDYRICGFDTFDIDNDGNLEIFVSSLQNPHWPTQLVSLSSQGKVLGEFWNSGHLSDFAFADLDKDGRVEILFAGLNNEYQKGCLVIFEADRIGGSSPQMRDEFRCPELDRGSEKYYILFLRTDVDIIAYPVEAVGGLNILKNMNISLTAAVSKIMYTLSPDLVMESVTFSHGFMQLHNEAVAEGKIKSTMDEKYRADIKNGILYYDGQGWTSKPTPVVRPGESQD
jgi:hypothetical protein